MEIRLATMQDAEGILSLLKANHVSSLTEEDQKEGFVTTYFTDEQMETLIEQEKGVIIAVDQGKVVAFATAAPWSFWAQWPLFTYMIEHLAEYAFRGTVLTEENCYQYGPVCVDKAYRGTGLFEKVFYASLESMETRFPIMATFINQVNPRSYAAHTQKVPMDTSGTFPFNGNQYYFMACSTSLKAK